MPQGIASNAGELRNTFADEDLEYAAAMYAEFLSFLGGVKSMGTDIGNGIRWESPIYPGWNGGGVISDGGNLGESRANSSVNPYVTLSTVQGMFSSTLLLGEVGKGKGAWTDPVRRGEQDVLRSMMTMADRYAAGCAGDGALATIQDTTTTSTSAVLSQTTAAGSLGGLLIDVGMPVQLHDGSSTERDAYTLVSSYTPSTRTVVFSDSQNLTAGDKVYFSLGATAGGTFASTPHLNGLPNLISDSGTVHALLRSTYPHWKAQVFSNGGNLRPYSDDIVHDALIATETLTKADGSRIDHLLSNRGIIRMYNKSIRADRRVSNSSADLSSVNTGVNTAPTFKYEDREIPWLSFTHIRPRTLYGIVKKHWRRFGKAKPSIMSGSELGISSGQRTATREVFAAWFIQIACARFNDQLAITDLVDPSLCGPAFGGLDE
jgi:hypothetical protein